VTSAAATAPRRRGWWLFLPAIFAYIAFGYLPAGPAFTPVGPAFLIIGGTVIACVLLALGMQGRLAVVPLAVAAGGILLTRGMPGAEDSYRLLVLGWCVLLSASFGVVSIIAPTLSFLPRGLATIAVAMSIAISGVAVFGQGLERVRAAVYSEAARRADEIDLEGQRRFSASSWRQGEARYPRFYTALRVAYDEWVHSLPQRTLLLLPALLALQSLAGLALGWELYHRLTRHNVGPPIAPLREFRFNDQMVWALAVGLTILVLPEFADGRAAALNILVFFGALFALRGLGVLASFRAGRWLLPLLALLLLVQWPIAVTVALVLGLADIWLDVRRRANAAT
jgi:hypothetical protein